MVEATLFLYRSLSQHKIHDDTECHYNFNLHKLIKVFKGNYKKIIFYIFLNFFTIEKFLFLIGMQQVQPFENVTHTYFVRLWYNELLHEFSDGLVHEADRNWFSKLLLQTTYSFFKLSEQELDKGTIFLDLSNTVLHSVLTKSPSRNIIITEEGEEEAAPPGNQ